MSAFEHRQTAHCESGVISGLLSHAGLPMSEPLAFGIGAGLTYAYLPFVKISGLPLLGYRMPPKAIIKGLCKRLGVKMAFETFRSPEQGMAALDAHLAQGRVVGAQTSVYWLDYFPPDMRFHFNAHNLIIHGKEGDEYLISDPVIDIPVRCKAGSLAQARFVRGTLAPKGLLYYPVSVPKQPDFKAAIRDAIRFTTGMMLYTPLPLIGLWGMRTMAKKLESLEKGDARYAKLFIGHLVRMQEEIGTGGAGFRFIYASFLHEAAGILGVEGLKESAQRLTAAGDLWREFALQAAKMAKERSAPDFKGLAEKLRAIAEVEKGVYRALREQV